MLAVSVTDPGRRDGMKRGLNKQFVPLHQEFTGRDVGVG